MQIRPHSEVLVDMRRGVRHAVKQPLPLLCGTGPSRAPPNPNRSQATSSTRGWVRAGPQPQALKVPAPLGLTWRQDPLRPAGLRQRLPVLGRKGLRAQVPSTVTATARETDVPGPGCGWLTGARLPAHQEEPVHLASVSRPLSHWDTPLCRVSDLRTRVEVQSAHSKRLVTEAVTA